MAPAREHVRFGAVAHYAPDWVLTNQDVIDRFGFDVDSAWIEARTGILSRHWLPEGLTTSDMAAAVCRDLLERAELDASDVDRLVLSTITPDHPSPATAIIVARKIGVRCMAFDLSAACAGFLYALDLGVQSIRAGAADNVLVVCADTRSRFVDPSDRRATVLFSDGAAGVLLQPSDEPGVVSIRCSAEGHEDLGAYIPAGGAKLPASVETVEAGQHYVQVSGARHIFDEFAGHTVEICDAALQAAGLTVSDIDVFLTHQGNALLVKELAAAMGIPMERTIDNVAHHGNAAGAALPIALSEALQDGRIRPGQTVLLSSVGAGASFGAAVYRT